MQVELDEATVTFCREYLAAIRKQDEARHADEDDPIRAFVENEMRALALLIAHGTLAAVQKNEGIS